MPAKLIKDYWNPEGGWKKSSVEYNFAIEISFSTEN
jgi:hypothetical protein